MNSLWLGVGLTLVLLAAIQNVSGAPNMICYYDSKGFERQGLAQFGLQDMELALQFCTHVIYGYTGINPDTYELQSINKRLDMEQRHFAQITALKDRYPYIKFLLSVGGDRDLVQEDKYIKLLEAGHQAHTRFIESSRDLVRRYNFDGLDLSLQLPRNKPRKVHGEVGSAWKSFKKFFTGDFIVDSESETHKGQLTGLIKDLSNSFRASNLLLSLTVLPNVNSSWYFDAPAIAPSLDMINLATFDFLTPDRNPEEADYTSPLYEAFGQNRLGHYNVNFQMEHWLLQRVPAQKLNIGIASYGRAWKLSSDSGDTGMPVVQHTQGPALAGLQTKTEGLLNWAEICQMMPNPGNSNPVRRVLDPTKRYGSYAVRPADSSDANGIWISYDDPDTASSKAQYARAKNLGGVALFDLTLDDFRGQCTGDRFPMLRAIKYRLLV